MLETETGPTDQRHLYRFAHCELSEVTGELRVRGNLVPLPPRDRALLFFLVRRAGEFVSNDEAITAVWGDYPASGKTVGNTIFNVRQAIGDEDHSIIKNERNRGYILIAPIEKTLAAATPQLQLAAGMAVPGRPDCLLEEKVGTGGYGDVWLCKGPEGRSAFKFSKESAHESAIKREVTISRLLDASLTDEQRQHFVPIVEWDFEVWPSYIETPYAGLNLKAWAASKGGLKTIPLSERLEIMATIADAVGLAHSVGALHKDLKPENVLIEEAGGKRQVRLTDFGAGHLLNKEKLEQLAITIRGWTRTRATDATSGTLLWMAPELFENAAPTLHSDLYSLGVLLYQMVVGDFGRILAPDWHPDITDELLLEDIDIATRRNPAQRLGDATELARRLRTLEQRRTEREQFRSKLRRTEQAEEELKKARARRPYVWATGAALLIGLCTSSYFYYTQLQRTREARALSDFVRDDLLQAALVEHGGTPKITLVDALIKAIPLARKRLSATPRMESEILQEMGNTFASLADYKALELVITRQIQIDEKLTGLDSTQTLGDRLMLANAYLMQGKITESDTELTAIRSKTAILAKDWRAYSLLLQVEAQVAFQKSDFAGTLDFYQRLIRLYETQPELTVNEQLELQSFYQQAASALLYAGRPAEAQHLLESRNKDLDHEQANESALHLQARMLYNWALRDQLQLDAAAKGFTSVCAQMQKVFGDEDLNTLSCHHNVAILDEYWARWDDASSLLGKVDAANQKVDGCPGTSSCIYSKVDYAFALARAGNAVQAFAIAKEAVNEADASTTPDATTLPYTLYILGDTALQANDIPDAESALDRLAKSIDHPVTQDPDWLGRVQLLSASIALRKGNPDRARQLAKQALDNFAKVKPKAVVLFNDAQKLLAM